MNDFMPLYPEKDEQHLGQFLWDSPNNGNLFFNKIVWNAQGYPIRLFGNFFGQQGLGVLYLEVFPNTSTRRHLFFRMLDYKQFYEDTTTIQHFLEIDKFYVHVPSVMILKSFFILFLPQIK